MKPLLVYLIIINALGFALMHADKHKARKKLWRIPESLLFLIAILGGSFGSLSGMYTAHHKTKKASFTIGMPIILAVQVVILVLLYTNTVGT